MRYRDLFRLDDALFVLTEKTGISIYDFFFWRGVLAGVGRYWWAGLDYALSDSEREDASRVAKEAARHVDVPFLVVDMAQTEEGRWVVIECNDGQESGYAGVSPFALWQKIAEIELRRVM